MAEGVTCLTWAGSVGSLRPHCWQCMSASVNGCLSLYVHMLLIDNQSRVSPAFRQKTSCPAHERITVTPLPPCNPSGLIRGLWVSNVSCSSSVLSVFVLFAYHSHVASCSWRLCVPASKGSNRAQRASLWTGNSSHTRWIMLPMASKRSFRFCVAASTDWLVEDDGRYFPSVTAWSFLALLWNSSRWAWS